MILARSQHPVVKEMRQSVMRIADSLRHEDVEFRLFLEGGDVLYKSPDEKKLMPEKLGVSFRFKFHERTVINRTEIWVRGEKYAEIQSPTKVDAGDWLYTSIELSA